MDRSFTSLDYIKARTEEQLKKLSLETAIAKGGMLQFVNIIYKDGFYYAWFYRHLKQDAGKSKEAAKEVEQASKGDLEKEIEQSSKKRRGRPKKAR